MENVSITKSHIISHNFCIEEDVCLQFLTDCLKGDFKQIKCVTSLKLLNFNFGWTSLLMVAFCFKILTNAVDP